MNIRSLGCKYAAIFILVLAAAGCAKPSAPTSFYMLGALAPPLKNMSAEAGDRHAAIGVETVKVPAYLDRNQIVTNLDDTEFHLADFGHWAEPLSDNLTRVVAENLARVLSGNSVDVFPADRSIPFDYSVEVEVLRLDGKMSDQVTLIARWAVFGSDEDDLLHLRKSEYREAVGDDSYKGLVLAYSRAVAKLSQEIAEAMKNTLDGLK